MDLEQLSREWTIQAGDTEARIAAWDSTAQDYLYKQKHNFTDDPFLHFVAQEVGLTREMRTLDIGCGAGAYSVALATRVGEAHGVDFSPGMIKAGMDYIEAHHIDNVKLWVCDRHNCDSREFQGKYDLVFARTTPAIGDLGTLQKMIAASKAHCFYCTIANRQDRVFDECMRIAGVQKHNRNQKIAYILEALNLMGYSPQVKDIGTVWQHTKSLEDTTTWFLGRLQMDAAISEEAQNDVKEYLSSISTNGTVYEHITTTLTNIYWHV